MAGYTKLFNSILASTIWREDDKVRIVWITLLAMADRDGVAEGSIPGLADMARVSIEDAEKALVTLSQPDKYSRSTEHEGRRIEAVEGGWRILNHAKYRQKMSADERREYNRKKQADWRARNQPVKQCQSPSITVNDSQSQLPVSAHTEAEAEEKADAEALSSLPVKRKASPQARISDEDWIAKLKADQTYAGIDIDREQGKMKAYCEVHRKTPSRQMFINWLNRVERPLSTSVAPAERLSFREQERERDAAVHKTINPTRGW